MHSTCAATPRRLRASVLDFLASQRRTPLRRMEGRHNPCRDGSFGIRGFLVPVHEFKCTDCGEDFEVDCHMHEREEKALCPACGSRNVESVLSAGFSSPRPPKFQSAGGPAE